jgi:hypothetical protein
LAGAERDPLVAEQAAQVSAQAAQIAEQAAQIAAVTEQVAKLTECSRSCSGASRPICRVRLHREFLPKRQPDHSLPADDLTIAGK